MPIDSPVIGVSHSSCCHFCLGEIAPKLVHRYKFETARCVIFLEMALLCYCFGVLFSFDTFMISKSYDVFNFFFICRLDVVTAVQSDALPHARTTPAVQHSGRRVLNVKLYVNTEEVDIASHRRAVQCGAALLLCFICLKIA